MVMVLLAWRSGRAHPERQAFFPDGSVGAVPQVRGKADQVLTVCKRTRRS